MHFDKRSLCIAIEPIISLTWNYLHLAFEMLPGKLTLSHNSRLTSIYAALWTNRAQCLCHFPGFILMFKTQLFRLFILLLAFRLISRKIILPPAKITILLTFLTW